MPRRIYPASIFLSLVLCFVGAAAASDVNFESAPVHPVDMSPNGDYLFVAHTADHRLVAYHVAGPQPIRIREVMVGIEPVTVRARTDSEVWVVNHVSGSISIVNVLDGNVIRTLVVGDQPTDVVFASGRAFVSVSQEDVVRVYTLSNLDAAPTDVPLDTSDPRSLAVSGDGTTVYVCALDSGNKTTVIPATVVSALGGLPAPTPPVNPMLPPPPAVGLIVQHNGTSWVDDTGSPWDIAVPYTLPDNDVVAISTSSLTVTSNYHGVGTTLFNLAVHPVSNDLYVTNQEAFNLTRFEPNLQGRFFENRITTIDPAGPAVTAHHINAHINYGVPAGDAVERALSLSMPTDVTISSTGDVYVAAFGSGKVGVLDSSGNVLRRIDVGGGPAGLALDEARDRLYVYNRFASSLSVVDLTDDSSVEMSLGFDPTPTNIRQGRKFLYDGEISSAHGDLSCGSCHVYGGMDNIAWDLGDPSATSTAPVPPGQLPGLPDFHPMKGPMTTQSLKSIQGTEPLHWRGDREQFSDFNPAFISLMGRSAVLDPGDFQLFEDFLFSIQYAPNPHLELSGAFPALLNGADPANGETLFLTGSLVGGAQCVDCHSMPTGENGFIIPGGALMEPEAKVVPQLRNMHEKTRFDASVTSTIRGFGFTHDGAVDDLFSFLQFPAFTFASDNDRRDVEAFLLAFPTGTHPAVGAQLTMDGTNEGAVIGRLNTLEGLADANTIGLVAKGRVGGQPRGWSYAGGGFYTQDKAGESDINQASLLALAGSGSEITFTGVVEGCEWRLGVDRDLDTHRDGDEVDAGSDPGDPNSVPGGPPTGIGDITRGVAAKLWLAGPNPAQFDARFGFEIGTAGPVRLDVFDVRGRLVRRLVNDADRQRGTHISTWDLGSNHGRRVSSGIYFVRMQTRDAVRVQRVAVVR